MALKERQTTIKSQPQAKKLWWGVLVFLVLQTAWVGYLLVKILITENPVGVTDGEKITTIIIAAVLFLLVAAALWGAYRLEKWVIIILWLVVFGAVLTLDWVSIFVNLIVAISYHYLLSRLKA